MKLEKIIIQGFKSFYFKTEISFPKGLTAIVGPNGGGKSNISDAILWALGEQSTKALRTSLMDEIISNGSKSNKPLSLAEVYLFFNNNDNIISIGRKLFRDGQSIYLLNGENCFLKNILDLLSSLNLAPKTYTVIEQNKIQFLLDSKPMERRIYIDDAAGISRYKHKKKETLNKLSSAQLNLQRINDILNEISKNRNSLKLQAIKTKKFFDLQKEFKSIKQRIFSYQWSLLQKNLKEINIDYDSIKKNLSLNNEKLTSLNAEIENIKQVILAKEEEITNGISQIEKINNLLSSFEKELLLCQSSKENLLKEINKKTDMLTEFNNKLNKIDIEVNVSSKKIEQLIAGKSIIEKFLNTLFSFKNISILISKYIKITLDKEKHLLFQYNFEENRLNNFISNNKKSLSKLIQKQQETKKFKYYITESLNDLTKKDNEIEKLLNDRKDFANLLSKFLSLLNNKIEEINNYLSILLEKETTINQDLSMADLYIRQLEVQLYEKYQFSISKNLQKEISNLPITFYGVLLDLIKIPFEYEQLVNFILKDKLFSLVVKDEKDYYQLQQYLKNYKKPFSILCLSFIENKKAVSPLLDLKTLSEFIDFPDELKSINFIFHNMFIIDSLKQCSLPLNPDVLIYGKKEKSLYHNGFLINLAESDYADNPIKLRKQLNFYKINHSLLNDTLYSLHYKKQVSKRMKEFFIQCLKDIKENLIFSQNKMDELENLSIPIKNKIKELLDKKEIYQSEEFQNIMQIKNYEREIEIAENNLNILQKDIKKHSHILNIIEELNKKLEMEISKIHSFIENSKIIATKVSEQIKASEENLKRIKLEKESLTLSKEKIIKEINEGKDEINKQEFKLLQLQEAIEKNLKQKDNLVKVLDSLKQEAQEKKAKINALEILYKKFYQEKESLIEKEHSLLIRKTQIEAEANYIKENSIKEIGQEPIFYSNVKDEEIKELIKQSESVQKKIQKVGSVNELAIDQYNEVNKKYEFYLSQQKDIEESINSLNRAIQKLDRFMIEKLQEALKRINENFQEYFSMIFKGGMIELYFEDQEKILESGLELKIKIPQKKISSFNLLSGGEKSLISLLFLFSILKYKPSCFCLWDEVDAALDENNIVKIIDIIKELKQHIQFIIITHNKYMMEAADQLIGISMEEEGISKILSIKLKDVA